MTAKLVIFLLWVFLCSWWWLVIIHLKALGKQTNFSNVSFKRIMTVFGNTKIMASQVTSRIWLKKLWLLNQMKDWRLTRLWSILGQQANVPLKRKLSVILRLVKTKKELCLGKNHAHCLISLLQASKRNWQMNWKSLINSKFLITIPQKRITLSLSLIQKSL